MTERITRYMAREIVRRERIEAALLEPNARRGDRGRHSALRRRDWAWSSRPSPSAFSLARQACSQPSGSPFPEHAALARRLAALRPWAKQELPTYEARRDYFQELVEEALA